MTTVSALFDTLSEARQSISDLTIAGFPREDINLVAHAGDVESIEQLNEGHKMHDVTETVTEAGTAVGGLGGLVVGLSFFFVPGVGPVLAAGGLLASLLSGAGLGALAGGALGTVAGLGVPTDQAETYAEGLRRGGSLVVVQSSDELAATARAVLDRHNPVDLTSRAGQWRESGWDRYNAEATPLTSEQLEAERRRYSQTSVMNSRLL